MKIGVIGLGYVGLTAAVGLAKYGHKVIGYDCNQKRIEDIHNYSVTYEGDSELFDAMREVLSLKWLKVFAKLDEQWKELNAVLICVGVNVSKGGIPYYDNLMDALDEVTKTLKPGALIIIETTLPAGTMDKILVPLLADDYQLAYCPERVTPGSLLSNFYNMPRVVGVDNRQTFDIVSNVYAPPLEITRWENTIIPDLHRATYIDAELCKLGENAYRNVMIAFANTMALTSEQHGGDVWKVRELINTLSDRYVYKPGPGVGGYCLQKDTRILAHGNWNNNLLTAAYHVNQWMPWHIASIVARNKIRKVLLLGVAYKRGVSDTRNSPAYNIGTALQMYGAKVVYHDPFVDKHRGEIYNKARECGAIVLVTNHVDYSYMNFNKLQVATKHATPLFIDTRGWIDKKQLKGWQYHCLGVGG